MRRVVRLLRGFGVAVLLFVALACLLSRAFQPGKIREVPPSPSPEKIAEAEALRDLTLAGTPPQIAREVDYAEQDKGKWFPSKEAPILRELVEKGQLPPLRERLGAEVDGRWVSEPLVMEGVDGVGNYGGTWTRSFVLKFVARRLSASTLLHYDLYGRELVPHLAKGYEVSPDNREFTFHLRRGIRWSDGHPFTADDILYWWNWEENCKEVRTTPSRIMLIRGKAPEVVKVDDYTVTFRFPEPYGAFLRLVPTIMEVANSPEHYLKQFHPTHPEHNVELMEKWQDAMKTRSAVTAYRQVKDFTNPEHPRMWPWLYLRYTTLEPQFVVRNPYYWVVDTQGNQLPYLDRILFNSQIQEAGVGLSQGQVSMQWMYNLFSEYTLYMRNREPYDYQVYHWWSGEVPFVVYPNITMREDAAENGAALSALLKDRRFRIALSVAIDRQQIIDAVYRGVGEPMAMVPEEGTRWYVPELTELHHQYDPGRANRLLDELGLASRDGEGFRTYPDGERLALIHSLSPGADVEISQFLIHDWRAVDLRVIPRPQGASLFQIERGGRRQQLSWYSGNVHYPLIDGINPGRNTAPGFTKWLNAGGPYAPEGAEFSGMVPPPDHPIQENIRLHSMALAEREVEKQKVYIDKAMYTMADQVWNINITKALPQLVLVKNGFRNVPRKALFSHHIGSPGGNTGIETYFWDEPLNQDDPGTVAILKELIVTPVLRVGGETGNGNSMSAFDGTGAGAWIAPVIRWLLTGVAVLYLVMIMIRHPFVRKRLLLMAPMLAVISILVFTIIQLPPGDYTTVRIAQLEEEGDLVQLQQIQEIRETFYLDKHVIVRYINWMGLRWFVTFEEKDKGLLQGNLGLSMKDNMPVNKLVGDRLMLTFFITLGSVLLTWTIAFPIGVYSAVKQYSIGDYFFTSLAFLGMCTPTFLLALVLMVVTGVTGLFSPGFAAMEGWNWAKVADLLKHIWLPVVIVGVASTAGMIRVMRANLLDELKKPYVVTARAKGVRPVKLLLKYPVRIALNPFISGIGGLFPALVSGSAIIAMVLALPTVGPLLLNAVLDQDMYLAGSMLMVLGLLSIFGTLVSDLLLVWLDPRIRYDK